jgi:hypothetical protein
MSLMALFEHANEVRASAVSPAIMYQSGPYRNRNLVDDPGTVPDC